MRFNDLCHRAGDGSVEQVVVDNFDTSPYYNVLYIHVLSNGIYAQKGDLKLQVNAAQLAKLISLLPSGTQIIQPDKLIPLISQIE